MKENISLPAVNYGDEMTLTEVSEKLSIVRNTFSEIRQQYPSSIEDHSLTLDEEHLNKIVLCIGVLLPLSLVQSVELQHKSEARIETTVYQQTEDLYMQIFEFAVGFKNTEVARDASGGYFF